MKWHCSHSGPGVPFLDRRGHYVSNDVSKVGKEHWQGPPCHKVIQCSEGQEADVMDEVGLSKSTVHPARGRLLTREDVHTSPSVLVLLRAGNNLKSLAPCPHHLQEGDRRTGRNGGQEDVCLSVTEFAGKRLPLLH